MSLHTEVVALIRAHEDEEGTFHVEVDEKHLSDNTDVIETISASMRPKLPLVIADLEGMELFDATRADVRNFVRRQLSRIIID